jgi:hypothetical protein
MHSRSIKEAFFHTYYNGPIVNFSRQRFCSIGILLVFGHNLQDACHIYIYLQIDGNRRIMSCLLFGVYLCFGSPFSPTIEISFQMDDEWDVSNNFI